MTSPRHNHWRRLARVIRRACGWTSAQPLLRSASACYRTFLDHSPVSAYIKDRAGRYVYVNRACAELFHAIGAKVHGGTTRDNLPREMAQRCRTTERRVLATRQPVAVVEVVPAPDGRTHYWLFVTFPFREPNGRGVVGGLVIDMTQQKLTEMALQTANADLREHLRELERLNEIMLDREERIRQLKEQLQILQTPMAPVVPQPDGAPLPDGSLGASS